MKTAKTWAVILLLAMSLSLLASCGGSSTTPQNAAETTTTQAVETEVTTAGRVKADLPAMNFDGDTITFLARIYDGVWAATDILAEEIDGEPINDALYERMAYIEDTYNVDLAVYDSNADDLTSTAKTQITAGDQSFQSIVTNVYQSGSLSAAKMLIDLSDMEYLDLSQPWWSQMTNDALTLGHTQYYVTGDIFIIDNMAIRVFFFNKDMIKEFNLESPYALVKNNEWTLDKYIEYNEAVIGDLNGNNVMERKYDRYGTMAQLTLGSVLYLGTGNLYISKDADDMPVISCDSEKALSIMNGIMERISGRESISCDDNRNEGAAHPDNLVYFQEGRVLFSPEVLLHIETMRGCDVDIGVLPPPKYDEKQDIYYCYADGYCVNVLSIPITNNEPEKVAFIMEAMAADSANNLTPAFYELALTEKYIRDTESVEMLDLILTSVVMDNANIFSWGTLYSTVTNALIKGDSISSSIEKVRVKTESEIAKTMEALLGE